MFIFSENLYWTRVRVRYKKKEILKNCFLLWGEESQASLAVWRDNRNL